MSRLHPTSSRAFSRGMSLIEIMVGMAIALVATLVIFQVFSQTSSSNRTTSSGNEAQISGNIGMFQMERDLKAAGMGFGTLSNAGGGCTVSALNSAGVAFNFPLVPVLITPGVAGVPDQIDVLYGNSSYLIADRGFGSGTPYTVTTVSSGGIQQGDLVVLTDSGKPPTVCELAEITKNSNADGLTVEHALGGYTDFYSGTVVAAAKHNLAHAAPLNANGVLYDLGPSPDPIHSSVPQAALNQWRVSNGSLTISNALGSGVATPVAEGIVHFMAQYGVDDGAGGATAGDGVISPSEWTTNAPANWSQVLAVRFALLARSPQAEKTAVTIAAPVWASGANTFTMLNLDGTPGAVGAIAAGTPWDANDWRYYRYRVFESVVAMRNMLWPKCYPVACS